MPVHRISSLRINSLLTVQDQVSDHYGFLNDVETAALLLAVDTRGGLSIFE